jgi:zinc transport system ATP-binding protein
MTAEPLISVERATVRFGDTAALEHVDLAVRPGEIVTLIGPNGAGKSTLLRVVLGLQRLDEGRVTRRPGLRIGYVPQRFAIDPTLPMTVARFLALMAPRGAGDSEAVLAEVGAPGLGPQGLATLSGGQFQRVLMAAALMGRPDLLVLDEPLQGVDVRGQAELFELIARLRRSHGFAVLMVSHDLHLVMRATDRVICLNAHVCCHGAPEAVGRDPSYAALFGAEAARAFAVYRHSHDHAHTLSGEVVTEGGR